jgi:hypothetical protein
MAALPFRMRAEHVYGTHEDADDPSFVTLDDAALWLERPQAATRHAGHAGHACPVAVLAASAHPALERFAGTRVGLSDDLILLRGPLNGANARALRETLPWLRPRPLGMTLSAGFGDRLGMATPGHVRALHRLHEAMPDARVAPIFAQQSVRENARTGRTPQDVLDDATWGAFAAGWHGLVGADVDQVKTVEDLDAIAAAGHTLYTFDPGDYVVSLDHVFPDGLRAAFDALPWRELETTLGDLVRRYATYSSNWRRAPSSFRRMISCVPR